MRGVLFLYERHLRNSDARCSAAKSTLVSPNYGSLASMPNRT
nr:MAG TPA: hypothetical protein [Bacteriophage sp.]